MCLSARPRGVRLEVSGPASRDPVFMYAPLAPMPGLRGSGECWSCTSWRRTMETGQATIATTMSESALTTTLLLRFLLSASRPSNNADDPRILIQFSTGQLPQLFFEQPKTMYVAYRRNLFSGDHFPTKETLPFPQIFPSSNCSPFRKSGHSRGGRGGEGRGGTRLLRSGPVQSHSSTKKLKLSLF